MEFLTNPDAASAVLSISIRAIAIGVILFFLLPLQIKDLDRPRDSLYALRLVILGFLITFAALSIPSLVYHSYKAQGIIIQSLSNLSSISTNISILVVTIWLVLLYTYREKK